MQSFQEAVYHGVPILGIPFFADQKYNAKKIAIEEIGLHLPFNELTKEKLLTSVTAILKDSKSVQVK
jgi:glucuronosyltransferase